MSCLFNSISYFIKDVSSQKIRDKICDYLESNKPIIEGIETKDILDLDRSNYISSMRQSSTWGGAIEIQAACNIWKLSIIVQNKRNVSGGKKSSIEFLPVSGNPKYTIELEWTGGHYEPVRAVKNPDPNKIKIIVLGKR